MFVQNYVQTLHFSLQLYYLFNYSLFYVEIFNRSKTVVIYTTYYMRFRILELRNQVKQNDVTLRVTNSKSKNKKIHFKLLTRSRKIKVKPSS